MPMDVVRGKVRRKEILIHGEQIDNEMNKRGNKTGEEVWMGKSKL